MKKFISFFVACVLGMGILPVPVLAANGQGSVPSRVDTVNVNDYSTDNWNRFEFNYEFTSGPDTKETFGVPTQTDAAARNPELENVRRNKDAAFIPPVYGIFSGEIPSEPSSPYHSNVKPDYAGNVTNYSGMVDTYGETPMTSGGFMNGTGASATSAGYPNEMGTLTASAGYMTDTGMLPSTSTMQTLAAQNPATSQVSVGQQTYNTDYLLTQPNLYEDGSIGKLEIPALDIDVKVFEGESVSNLKQGVGHFEFTSTWDGNVCIAGHNRGPNDHMNGIWNLENWDEIIYTTKYGQRVYRVFSKEQISDTDYSKLGWSGDNLITLITCVKNQPQIRWCIQGISTK